jgi:hypothetical protein
MGPDRLTLSVEGLIRPYQPPALALAAAIAFLPLPLAASRPLFLF